MAKKDFSADALDAFELERPKKPKAEPAPVPQPAAAPAPAPALHTAQPAQTIPLQPAATTSAAVPPAAPVPVPAATAAPQPALAPPPEELIRRTYYISPAQHKALKIRAATSDNPEEKDISKIVRAAIDMYLSKP